MTLFLNCGMRLSELVGLDLSDVKEDTVKVTGKGDKERVIYLNDACKDALGDIWPYVERFPTPTPPKRSFHPTKAGVFLPDGFSKLCRNPQKGGA